MRSQCSSLRRRPTMSAPAAAVLLLLLQISTAAVAIGINYGTLANNLRPPAEVVNFIRTKTKIDRVKLFDTNPEILRAFAGTGILVTVTVGNGEIPALSDLANARQWVAAHIAPFHPQTRIHYIAVGNEIMHSNDKPLIARLVPAMRAIHRALVLAGITDIKVMTLIFFNFLFIYFAMENRFKLLGCNDSLE